MALTKISYSLINGAPINILDFGADSTGNVDSTAAIQAAFDYAGANHCQVNIPVGVYKTSSTLYIDKDNVLVYGQGNPSTGAGASRGIAGDATEGPVINYTGTACALQVSKSRSANPNSDGTNPGFIAGVQIRNLRIEVSANCAIAMLVYQPASSHFYNVVLWGNQASGTTLLKVFGGLDTTFEKINSLGIGRYTSGVPNYTYYTNYGLDATLGYSNTPATTTIFRGCYFHYCNIGARLLYLYQFEDCIFEACKNAVEAQVDVDVSFLRCWWEANVDFDFTFANTTAYFTNCRFNSLNRQQFFFTGGGVNKLVFSNTEFFSNDATPYVFGSDPGGNNIFNGALTYPGEITFNNCLFPANTKIGYIYNSPSVNLIQIENMRKQSYQFTGSSVAANTVTTLSTTNGFGSYTIPNAGHIVGLNIYASSALSAGSFYWVIKLNGSTVAVVSYPAQPLQTVLPFQTRFAPFFAKVAEDDVLTVDFGTTSGWSPTNNVCLELLTALGPSGEI